LDSIPIEQNILVLIPCSKRKNLLDRETKKFLPSKSHGEYSDLPNIENLRNELIKLVSNSKELAERDENKNGILKPGSPYIKAIKLYNGNFYKNEVKKLIENLINNRSNIRVLIISAFYGIAKPDEYLNLYNLRMDDKLNTVDKDLNRVYKFWEKNALWDTLYNYIELNNIYFVWSLLPKSYHLIFSSLWDKLKEECIKCCHVNAPNAGNGTSYKRAEWLKSFLKSNGDVSKINKSGFNYDPC